MAKIGREIISELQEQLDALHGTYPPGQSDDSWVAIVVEQVGNAARESLCGGRVARRYELRMFILQIIAILITWLSDIDGGSFD